MASAQLSPVIRFVHRIASGQAAHQSDCQLLDLYTKHLDEDAFAILVHRYSGLVLSVCRRILLDSHAAEDCCQAVFLILALQASSIKKAESLGPWLHGVALKVAGKARFKTRAIQHRERKAAVSNPTGDNLNAVVWRDLRPFLDDAIAHLPDKYRIPVVLCYLQGRSVSDIAQHLDQPRGTVSTRLTRGRELLRQRLTRDGITLSVAGLAAALADNLVLAAVPQSTVARTIGLAQFVKAGICLRTNFGVSSKFLSKGIIGTMFSTKLKILAGISLCIALLGHQGFKLAWAPLKAEQTHSQPTSVAATIASSSTRSLERTRTPPLGELEDIPLALLRRHPVDQYRVGPGDTLGIVVDRVLGDTKELIPTNPEGASGYPIPVRDDGTINLPKLQPLKVAGLTIEETKRAIRQAYVGNGKFFKDESKYNAIVNMYRKRTFKVLVIRQDVDDEATSLRNGLMGKLPRGTGQVFELTMGENDLGTALVKSGGMPGSGAMDVVVIEKARSKQNGTSTERPFSTPASKNDNAFKASTKRLIRIRLKVRVGHSFPFLEDDIILEDGDVVFVPARQWVAEIFSGILSAGWL